MICVLAVRLDRDTPQTQRFDDAVDVGPASMQTRHSDHPPGRAGSGPYHDGGPKNRIKAYMLDTRSWGHMRRRYNLRQ